MHLKFDPATVRFSILSVQEGVFLRYKLIYLKLFQDREKTTIHKLRQRNCILRVTYTFIIEIVDILYSDVVIFVDTLNGRGSVVRWRAQQLQFPVPLLYTYGPGHRIRKMALSKPKFMWHLHYGTNLGILSKGSGKVALFVQLLCFLCWGMEGSRKNIKVQLHANWGKKCNVRTEV